ncbi:MAG TPA: VWA domain-containing protein [Burkholderiales bacterium]|nr:VWA domain-containing protein [Burkholderiales bacterium]
MEGPQVHVPAPVGKGKLADNVMHFARVLRAAGLPVGPGKVLDALAALEIAGVDRRDDFYWTLAAVFVDRREQFEIFDQAFHIFWRDPKLLERVMSLFLPQVHGRIQDDQPEMSNRLAEALMPRDKPGESPEAPQEVELDATFTVSDREVLQRADFESMTNEELAQAKKLIANLRLPIPEVRTRRLVSDARGRRVDLRATLRASLRTGADIIPLRRRSQESRHPPLVVLCDISGSMSRYSRMFLHFLHAITNDRDRVHTFVYGTRLTNITRHLRHRDVDVALAGVAAAVADWSGGTRIGASIKEFNLRWSRRVLGQNAVVLLITDGLDRDLGKDLGPEMERLHKSCRKLIWLNPLLRYEGFEPRPLGVRVMLPHVDAFLPAHNIDSLIALGRALSAARTESGATPARRAA